MRNTFFLLLFLISGACFSQNPDPFWDGIRTKLVQPDTLSTFDRDALTPKLGTILYHKDTGISQWEQWDGAEWKTFGEGIPRDSLIVQSPSSFGNIYNYWEGTEAQMDALLLSDPNFFDDILWICTDCPQQGSGGTANQFVMGDGSFKNFIDDDTFASATSTNIPSAESVKAYVDANVFEVETDDFTPTISSTSGSAVYSYNVENAVYVKINNLVHISIYINNISNTGTPGPVFGVNDLPFSLAFPQTFSGAITGSVTSTTDIVIWGTVGSTSISPRDPETLNGLNLGNFSSGTIVISGTYITND